MTIHIINPLLNDCGGSERRSIGYFKELSLVDETHLWTEFDHSPALSDIPISRITQDSFPRDGIFIFVGSYFKVGNWIANSCPKKIIFVVNNPYVKSVLDLIENIKSIIKIDHIDFIYASQWLKDTMSLEGFVDYGPIDLEEFSPSLLANNQPFTVGRLSRDVNGKHHPQDPEIYNQLISIGCKVKVMGGHALKSISDAHLSSQIQIISEGSEKANQFLNSLDCFYYRTHPSWKEPHGRVIVEAMASGLPTVLHSHGGYAEFVKSGINGFLFNTNEEAIFIINYLYKNPLLRKKIGSEARSAIEAMQASRKLFPAFVLK